jgi:hypothetical protein
MDMSYLRESNGAVAGTIIELNGELSSRPWLIRGMVKKD